MKNKLSIYFDFHQYVFSAVVRFTFCWRWFYSILVPFTHLETRAGTKVENNFTGVLQF